MKYYKWYAVSLFMFVQIIAGCGGGGGGGTVVLPPADATAPTLSSFSLSSTSASLTVPISSLTATDNVGVTGFIVTESATAPAASASGWSASVPASFSFTTAGTKTAYAWAKDAAGNVSSALSATTNIILTDTTAPTLSSFSLSSTSASLTVPISSLTATDNVGVTGFMVTESATAPAASASGWSASVPTSFSFTTAGTKTANAWAKDAAGNVSDSRLATVAITLPTTKTVTWKISSGSATQVERIGGFDLTVILPAGSVVPTEIKYDSYNNPVVVPLSSAVYLSGVFQGASPLSLNTFSYDLALRELKINYPTSDIFGLGEVVTIITTVPISYTPNTNDININVFKAYAPFDGNSGGGVMPSVTATAAFN